MRRRAQNPVMSQAASPTLDQTLPTPPFRISLPVGEAGAVVVSSPHSGRSYPAAFVAASRLAFAALRQSEDGFVDELFEGATSAGVPLLVADFPRSYCDVNREPWELDPLMFADKLPSWCNTSSAKVLAGFGTIARLVSFGEPIYRGKLTFAEAERRVSACWNPYHDALAALISTALDKHGVCLLLDAHSMPSAAGWKAPGLRAPAEEPDFVLGDAYGTSCAQSIACFAERFLVDRGFSVRRNDPYAGGYVTRHYGRPMNQVHVMQLEICRGLYMNERRLEKLDGFDDLRLMLLRLVESLASRLPDLVKA